MDNNAAERGSLAGSLVAKRRRSAVGGHVHLRHARNGLAVPLGAMLASGARRRKTRLFGCRGAMARGASVLGLSSKDRRPLPLLLTRLL